MQKKMKLRIGFIGQGYIGRHYANDFECRGFTVVRYAKEAPYVKNKEQIATCDIVFIAVPTPTTPSGFDASIVSEALSLVGKGMCAVIKSTIIPGTTRSLQNTYKNIYIFHSPEFLTEVTAAFDAAHPVRNIIGMPVKNSTYTKKANLILSVLPRAPFQAIVSVEEAECIKYANNAWFYTKVVYMNLVYDLAEQLGCQFSVIREALAADPRIGSTHLDPVHGSGRGAGGHCFIKDFKAFVDFYEKIVGDVRGVAVLHAIEDKNISLLVGSGKDSNLLRGVYGDEIIGAYTKN